MDNYLLMIKLGSQNAGTVWLHKINNVMYIDSITVYEKYRGNGIGKHVMYLIENIAKERKFCSNDWKD